MSDTEINASVNVTEDVLADVEVLESSSALVSDDDNIALTVDVDLGEVFDAQIESDDDISISLDESIGAVAADHRVLLHRDAANQHPMSAISGLEGALTGLGNELGARISNVEDESALLTASLSAALLRIGDLQNQVDGNITTWFYAIDPTMSSPPVTVDPNNPDDTGWDTDAKKNKHKGDLYYNTVSGYAWRFMYSSGVYSWQRISDVDVVKALNDAAHAQDTADSKRRVFYGTASNPPTPPYDEGDLWVQGNDGDILRCAYAKAEDEPYSRDDWVRACKYTDDYTANLALTSANGKTTVFHQASKPSGGVYKQGDTWFNSTEDYAMYTYDEVEGDWIKEEFGTDAIENLSITNGKIANATIENGKIVSLDAAKITTGSIISDVMKTNVITAINGNDGDVKISGNKINIQGVITAINNDTTTTIDGDKITTGSISADRIDATSGTFNTANIPNLSADKIDVLTKDGTSGIYLHPSGQSPSSGSEGNSVKIDNNGLKVYKGSTLVASYGDTAQVGKSSGGHTTIQGAGMQVYGSNGTVELANIGYGSGNNDESGVSNAPYYTFGERLANSAVGNYSVAEGCQTTASGFASHAEGVHTIASGHRSHAEGGDATYEGVKYYTTASGSCSHAEGAGTTASGSCSHAEGEFTTASSDGAHVEGLFTTASNSYAHAEGSGTTASGYMAHAEGEGSIASGRDSHAQNLDTIAASDYQTALGRYNVADSSDTYAVIIGRGSSNNDRQNALTVDWSGNVYAYGNVNIRSGRKYQINGTNLSASDVGAVPTTRTINSKALSSDIALTASDVSAVPTTRTVNGNALSSNITLSASDVSAVPTTRTVNSKALSSNITLTASDVSAVPTTRTVNNKALSSDITLSASDIGLTTVETTPATTTTGVDGAIGTLTNIKARRYGNVISMTISTQSSSSGASSGGNVYKAKLSDSTYYPQYFTTGGSYYGAHAIAGSIGTDGTIVIRNASSSSVTITGTNSCTVTFTYIL